MDKHEFDSLFREAMRRALIQFGLAGHERQICEAEVHAPRISGGTVPLEEVLEYIYIDHDFFYKIIDVGILVNHKNSYIAFIRVSGHMPVLFYETYNPGDLGPFKVLAPFSPNEV